MTTRQHREDHAGIFDSGHARQVVALNPGLQIDWLWRKKVVAGKKFRSKLTIYYFVAYFPNMLVESVI